MSGTQIIKGSLVPIIMKLLDEHGRMYGYEITKVVKEMSQGKIAITEAALYPALHKLEADGLLVTQSEKVDGRMRKYYSLSKQGKTDTPKQLQAMQDAMETLRLLLNLNLKNG